MFRDDPNLVHAQNELESARQQGHRFGEFSALYRFGTIYSSMAEVAENQNQEEWRKQNWQHAIESFQQAHLISHELGDEKSEIAVKILVERAQWRVDGGDSSSYYEYALANARQKTDLKLERMLLLTISFDFDLINDRANALDYHRQAIAVSRQIGDQWLLIEDLCTLGAHYMGMEAEDYVSAIPCYEEALTMAQAVTPPEPLSIAGILGALGNAYTNQDLTKSIEFYEQAIAIQRENGSELYSLILNLNDLARLYAHSLHQQKAIPLFEEALRLTRTTGDKQAELFQLTNTSFAVSAINQELALNYAQEALDFARRSGDQNSVVNVLNTIAALYSRAGKVDEEIKVLEEALAATRKNNNSLSESGILARLSGINKQLGNVKEATNYSKQSLLLRVQENDFFSQISLAQIYEDEGDLTTALEYSQRALDGFIDRKNQASDDLTKQNFEYWIKRAQDRDASIRKKMDALDKPTNPRS